MRASWVRGTRWPLWLGTCSHALVVAGGVPLWRASWLGFPFFATPRSVHHLAAVAAGAYPPRRRPNAWSPGVPAPPGPCYLLVASGTPVGWRGGCLAAGLVRGAVRQYCLSGCSALVACAWRSRPVRGGLGLFWALCLPRFPLSAPHFPRCVWRAVPSGCPLSSLAGTPLHAVCAFRGLGPVALLVFPACSFVCVCARALAASAPPPPPWVGVARAPCAVPVLGAGRAVPRGTCPSACPASVPCCVWFTWGCALSLGWVRAWGPVTNSTARARVSWLCALWGRHEGARGGRLLPGCGASGVGRSPNPDHSSFRACSRGPLPTGCGCGGCGRGDPSPIPQRALLRAGFARCGAGTRAHGGGAPLPWVPGVRVQALSHPRPLVLSGVRPGPTTHWLWVRGCGSGVPSPTPPRALLRAGVAHCGGGMRVPGGGGASCLGVQDRALSHLRPPVLWGVRPGPTTHWLWVRGMQVRGPVTNPTARALAS